VEHLGGGAAELLTLFGFTRDYVEFGQDLPFAPTNFWHWSGSYGAVVPDAGKTLGREPGGEDTDRYGDWCGQPATLGAANEDCICSSTYKGGLVIDTVVWGHWTTDELIESCDTLRLSWPPPSNETPFSIAPGVTFTLRAGRTVVFNSGTNIPSGATLTIEIDPQLRQ
jgi:hypothetical protein